MLRKKAKSAIFGSPDASSCKHMLSDMIPCNPSWYGLKQFYAIVIFQLIPDRPLVKNRAKVEALQERYLDMLRSYLKLRRPKEHLLLPKVLMKLTELRTLNNSHSELLFHLKLQDQNIPPLIKEICDFHWRLLWGSEVMIRGHIDSF